MNEKREEEEEVPRTKWGHSDLEVGKKNVVVVAIGCLLCSDLR